MQPRSASDRFVYCSARTVLQCRCGERLVLLGLEEDWSAEEAVFECECGEMLTFENRLSEETLGVMNLLRSISSSGD